MKKSLFALALALGLSVTALSGTPAVAASEPTFITYNIRNCCNSDDSLTTSRTWDDRKAAVANTMNESGGEIFALQEANPYNSKTGRKGTPNVFPAEYLLAKMQKLQPAKKFLLATPRESRRPIIYASSVFTQDTLRDVNGNEVDVEKPLPKNDQMAQFTHVASKKKFVVANVHLATQKVGEVRNSVGSEELRQEQLRTVVRTVRPIANKYTAGRAIYMGDINTWTGRKLTGANAAAKSDAPGKMMKAASIPEARDVAEAKGAGYASFNGWAKPEIGPRTIDRVWVKSLPVTRWRVVHDARSGASDHFPVKVQLRF